YEIGKCLEFRRVLFRSIAASFVHTEAESRTCLSIYDPEANTLTELYERGEPISPDKLDELREHFRTLVPGCEFVALCGSLPTGRSEERRVGKERRCRWG